MITTEYSHLVGLLALLRATDDEKKRVHGAYKQWLVDHHIPDDIIAQCYPPEVAKTPAEVVVPTTEPAGGAAGTWASEISAGTLQPNAVMASRTKGHHK